MKMEGCNEPPKIKRPLTIAPTMAVVRILKKKIWNDLGTLENISRSDRSSPPVFKPRGLERTQARRLQETKTKKPDEQRSTTSRTDCQLQASPQTVRKGYSSQATRTPCRSYNKKITQRCSIQVREKRTRHWIKRRTGSESSGRDESGDA